MCGGEAILYSLYFFNTMFQTMYPVLQLTGLTK